MVGLVEVKGGGMAVVLLDARCCLIGNEDDDGK